MVLLKSQSLLSQAKMFVMTDFILSFALTVLEKQKIIFSSGGLGLIG